MSPAISKRRPNDPADTSSIGAMADAMSRKRAAEIEQTQHQLDTYRRAVELEARREPIPAEVADAALSAASDLGLSPSRLTDDVGVLRQAWAIDEHRRNLSAQSEAWEAERSSVELRLLQIEAERRELMAKIHRTSSLGFQASGLGTQRLELRRQAPHLFVPADQMTPAEWNHVRRNG